MKISINTVESKQCDFKRPEYKTSVYYGRLRSFKELVCDKFKNKFYRRSFRKEE